MSTNSQLRRDAMTHLILMYLMMYVQQISELLEKVVADVPTSPSDAWSVWRSSSRPVTTAVPRDGTCGAAFNVRYYSLYVCMYVFFVQCLCNILCDVIIMVINYNNELTRRRGPFSAQVNSCSREGGGGAPVYHKLLTERTTSAFDAFPGVTCTRKHTTFSCSMPQWC